MIVITLTDTMTDRSATVEFPSQFGPAFRSALRDMSEILGSRLSVMHNHPAEQALTEATIAVNQARVLLGRVVDSTENFSIRDTSELERLVHAASTVIQSEDPDYE